MADTKFKPGQSGNPGGRPKGLYDVQALARTHTTQSIATLVEICTNANAAPAARVAAANAILDRGWGKPVQPTEVSGPDGSALPAEITVSFVKPNS